MGSTLLDVVDVKRKPIRLERIIRPSSGLNQ